MDAWDVLKEYRVTEKTSGLSANENCYTFEVAKGANRIEIAKAIESAFKVKVKDVRTLNRKPKVKRGRARKTLPGTIGGIKKAMLVLKKGYKIEII